MSHHGEASEHVSNDVHNHASMFRHVLLVRLKRGNKENIYIIQNTFSGHEVGASQISLNHSIPALGGIFHWVLAHIFLHNTNPPSASYQLQDMGTDLLKLFRLL